MTQDRERIKWQKVSGAAVTVGDVSATPQSQALSVRWPHGGWVWNRPVALLVERNGKRERIPIVDVTRVAQLALYGLSVVLAVVGLVMWVQERSRSDG